MLLGRFSLVSDAGACIEWTVKDVEHDEPELQAQMQFSVRGRHEALNAAVAEGLCLSNRSRRLSRAG
jgi:hypothetical protein